VGQDGLPTGFAQLLLFLVRRGPRRQRDFSLRRPTTLQEQSGMKKRRPAPFEMTVWGCGGWLGEVESQKLEGGTTK